MNSRIAIIDMGTNTFHLLIAQVENGNYTILHSEKTPVKIGKGGINHGLINEEGKRRALDGLAYFKRVMTDWNCDSTLAFGTSALRSAKNGQEVIREIKEITGIDAKIISGEEEALYIYKGVAAAVKMGEETSLIVDIGGGSVEFIVANAAQIFWKQSLDIGAQRLLEKFHHHDPILKEEIDHVEKFLSEALRPVFAATEKFKPTALVGSSGTFDTLSEMHCIRNGLSYSPCAPETPMSLNSFFEIHAELISKNRSQRLALPGMIEMRVDMIVVAFCLIHVLVQNISFDKIRVSSFSLKEGVLASLVENKRE